MTIAVRKAQPEDATVIALLGRLTFRETFGALFAEHEGELQAYLQQTFCVAKIASSMSKPENSYWLSTLDDLPIGYAKQKFPSPNLLVDDAAPAQLQKIYVLAEFLGHGIGRVLLQAAMLEASSAQVEAMWLTVLDSNDRAIRFYERHGWTSAGTANFAIGTQEFSFLVMRTEI